MIDLGRELPQRCRSELQTEENIVEGCMSTVWLVTGLPGGVDQPMEIQADSDSIIVKGLIVILLLAFYSRQTSAEIVDSNVGEFLRAIGLGPAL
jgi:cysteine desulfuration protein SufE